MKKSLLFSWLMMSALTLSMATAPVVVFAAADTSAPGLVPIADPNSPAPAPSQVQGSHEAARSRYNLVDPLQNATLPELASRLIRFMIGIVGAIFLLTFIAGGFLWMTAGGDKKRLETAQKMLSNAVIGLVIITLSYTMVVLFMQLAQTFGTPAAH